MIMNKKTGKHNYVAGTVGSYGAYLADGNEYRGDYELSELEYLAFHLPRLRQTGYRQEGSRSQFYSP